VSRRWLVILAVLIAGAAGSLWWVKSSEPLHFVAVPAAKGDVARSIIATGTVNPVVTVQVGSYVSGVIQSLHCDFNTEVKAGQLCAKIDPRPYQMTVDQAKANLASAKAQLLKDQASLAYAKTNYERDRGLLKRGIVSQDTVDSDKSAYDQGLAQVKLDEATILQRDAALKAAQVNLDYTDIVSPVDGTVVLRNVDVGQTVAASFQTPTLFLIAKDLTKMQVDTNVSETDVGGARVGQDASFTVEAYPNKRFHGMVAQIRQAPITVQNVVTYDVVISVDNPKLLLFPGMTANVRIITDDRKDVLKVPLQALRFEPKGLSPEGGANETPRQTGSRVWVLRGGRPVPIPVKVGIDDGTSVEITGGSLEPGARVIVDEVSGSGQRGGGERPARSPFRF
jgi:HlyD family secretion protein